MPKEAGFTWRPTEAELLDPSTNLFWGTRTLAIVVRQGKGDIFNSLAAYNGGWAQIMYRGPKIFATAILRDFAEASALRHGLADSGWIAHFAVDRGVLGGPIWIADADRDDVYLYGNENRLPSGVALIPATVPTERVANCSEGASPCLVGLWLQEKATGLWLGPADVVPPPPTPTPVQPDETARSVMAVMAGSVAGHWSATAGPALATETAPSATSAPSPTAEATVARVPVASTLSTDDPVLDPTATPVPTETLACAGGPLALDAWPLDTIWTEEGWKVVIYAQGHGGDCSYTYAWNDDTDLRAEHTRDCTVFEVFSDRRDAAILGSVLVTAGDETQRVGIYVKPPW